jgi:hypothetical protein
MNERPDVRGQRRKRRLTRSRRPSPAARRVRSDRARRPKLPVGVFVWLGLFGVLLSLGIFGALYLPVREARFAALEVRLEQPYAGSAYLPLVEFVAAPSPSGSVEHVAANGSSVTVPGGLAGRTMSVRLYVDDDALDALASQLGVTPRRDTAGRPLVTISAENMSVQAIDGGILRAATLPPSRRETSMWGDSQELTFGFEQPPADDPDVVVDVFPAPRPPWDEPIRVEAVLTLNGSYNPQGVQIEEASQRQWLPLVLSGLGGAAPFSILQVDIAPNESSTYWKLVLNGVEGTDFVGPVSEVTARGFDGLLRAKATRRAVSSWDEVSMVAEGEPLFASYVDGRLSVTGVARSASTAFGDELLPTRWDLWPSWGQTFTISAVSSLLVGLLGYGLGLWRGRGRARVRPVTQRVIYQRAARPRAPRRRRPPPAE